MNFKRRQKTGRSAKVYKEWYDETKQYRITWRSEVAGVATTPAYHACVLCQRPDGREYWDFAECRRPYRTLNAAQKACEANQKLWLRFLETGQVPPGGHPSWVIKQAGPLWKSPSVRTKTSANSGTSSTGAGRQKTSNGPASSVEAADAPTVKAPATGRAKRSSRSTARRSPSTRSKSKGGTNSKRRGGRRSRN